jgi:hypothetical protein
VYIKIALVLIIFYTVETSCKEFVLALFPDELYALVTKWTLLLKVLDKMNCFRDIYIIQILPLGRMLIFKG